MESSKIWPFRTLSVTHYRLEKQKEDVYERDIQQQEEGKGLNRGTPEPEHLAISDVSISMVTHYFDESFLWTEEDYVNTYSKSHLSDSIVEDRIFSEEFSQFRDEIVNKRVSRFNY